MIKGIGVDIIEVDRIEGLINRHGSSALDRLFTAAEQAYCQRYKATAALHYAGRFAAKEAVVKALGTGFRKGISWHDIEILNDEQGKPHALLSPQLRSALGDPTIEVAISHCRSYAMAFAIRT